MGVFDDYKPIVAMLALQCIYAGVSLSARVALLEGMSPLVLVVYRQALSTLVLAPIAYFSRRRNSNKCSLGWRSFSLIFLASFVGVTIYQTIFYEGIYLASSSIGSALFNLVPAITFILAVMLGLEKVDLKGLRSIAKILGTILCAGGAVAIVLIKGPKLLNAEFIRPANLVLGSESKNWLLGSLLCFGSSCCFALWLILQVPISKVYPDHLCLSVWMSLMAALQSAVITFFLEPNLEAWKIHSLVELGASFYAGVIGSGVGFIIQAWCISKRGPVFSAMFNPVCTLVVTIIAGIFLHEEIFMGSLIGAVGVIVGLYVVLWGKAKDFEDMINAEKDLRSQVDDENDGIVVHVRVDQSYSSDNNNSNERSSSKTDDLVEPLILPDKSVRH